MSKLAIILVREGPKSRNKTMVDISVKYYTGYCSKNKFLLQTMADKVLRHFVVKFDLSVLVPSPQNNVEFSISSVAQSTAPSQH